MIYKSETESDLIEVDTSTNEKNTLCLNDEQIINLAKTMHRLEKYYAMLHDSYHMSIDVEWAVDG